MALSSDTDEDISVQPSDRLLRQFVGYNIKRAYMQLQGDLTQTLAPFGLRIGTFSALAVVLGSEGISQTQLSEVLNIKRSGVVVLVDELENLGAIDRKPVETDRRAYALQVTAQGWHLWQNAERAVQSHEDALFDKLAVEDIRTLRELLVRATRSATRKRQEADE
ncbi:MarR family winged helix-turn-helix transcriptional regulator [Primorskyibacter flagellatus]|uniref:DNA-binding transcriptional regulator, MarR family n=1 Tax=Primorskyibacter flagellatus TaxID=1387277 RepID=A0A1W2E6L9_9RHOB|nr:MarR family transcriptional regulator [Primorskyibacter flagellatus]SMD05419.1 DNA-binding transcriptional regulator, MarR family [Primorskyibacter flagellatus]